MIFLPRSTTTFSSRQLVAGRIFISGLNDRQPLADNHHPVGTGPPELRESRLVQAALPFLNLLNTMQLKKLPRGARYWHSACSLSGGPFFPSKVAVPRRFKLLAALLGFLIAITGAVSAQNRTTKRRIDFNASNNKERAQQGAPLCYPGAN